MANMKYKCIYLLNTKELMHRDTNNRVAQWTSMETKSETRGPNWRAAHTMNTHTANKYQLNLLKQDHY